MAIKETTERINFTIIQTKSSNLNQTLYNRMRQRKCEIMKNRVYVLYCTYSDKRIIHSAHSSYGKELFRATE